LGRLKVNNTHCAILLCSCQPGISYVISLGVGLVIAGIAIIKLPLMTATFSLWQPIGGRWVVAGGRWAVCGSGRGVAGVTCAKAFTILDMHSASQFCATHLNTPFVTGLACGCGFRVAPGWLVGRHLVWFHCGSLGPLGGATPPAPAKCFAAAFEASSLVNSTAVCIPQAPPSGQQFMDE